MTETFDVEMPDGTIIEGVPVGTTKAQIMAKYQRSKRMAALPQSMANIEADQASYSPTNGMTGSDMRVAGMGKAFVDLGRGAGQLVGAVSRQDVADARAMDAPLMETTSGKIGNVVGNVAALAPSVMIPGANTVAGAGVIGGVSGLLQPSTSTKETLTNVGLGTVLGGGAQKAGQVIGDAAGAGIAARRAAATAAQSENAVRDATIAASRKAGYVLPPATINQGSRGAAAVESLSGRAATAQTAAYRNQAVTNRLIRQDLGLTGRGQITPVELQGVRQRAGKVYEAVSNSGRIVPDQQYLDEVANLGDVLQDVAQEFPGAKAPSGENIRELADTLFQQDFDSGAAIKYVRQLREQARDNFKAVNSGGGDADRLAMAKAQREAAGILEDQVLRHLRATGKDTLADSFDKARTTIAKAHDAEAALNPATGNIDAAKLGAKLRRNKPMSGNFETVANFAAAFPEAAREIKNGPGVSALSAMLSTSAGVGGLLSGNPAVMAGALLPFARGGARTAILSGPGQRAAMPAYSASSPLLRLMQQVAPLSAPVAVGVGNSKEQ